MNAAHHVTFRPRGGHFLGQLLAMTVAMLVGMIPAGAIFSAIAGMTVDQSLRRHAVSWVVAMAFAMTVPMVGWMRFRAHSWRSCAEMAAVTIAPAVPLCALRVSGAISGPICGFYCMLSVVAMIGLMIYRREGYGRAVSVLPSA